MDVSRGEAEGAPSAAGIIKEIDELTQRELYELLAERFGGKRKGKKDKKLKDKKDGKKKKAKKRDKDKEKAEVLSAGSSPHVGLDDHVRNVERATVVSAGSSPHVGLDDHVRNVERATVVRSSSCPNVFSASCGETDTSAASASVSASPPSDCSMLLATLSSTKTLPGVGLVYEAPPPTFLSDLVAYVTLTAVFGSIILAPVIAVAWAYWIYIGSWLAVAMLVLVMSSPFWAFGVSESVRRSRILQSWQSYFHLRVWKEERMPEDQRNVLFALFPHGMFPMTLAVAAGITSEIFPEWGAKSSERFSAAVASVFFKTPLLSPLLTWLGCHPCDPPCLRKLVRRGSCILLPDGIAGVFHSNRHDEVIFVNQRKGFVKLALQEGATLVPVYAFGHTQLHDVAFSADSLVARLSRYLRIALVFFTGRWGFLPLPHRFPLLLAVGKPMLLSKCENPTEEQVNSTHAVFVQELEQLFERNKHRVGWDSKKLRVI